MWIDFKLCSYFWFDNRRCQSISWIVVVNWFQIMFLFLVRQLHTHQHGTPHCCELISNYVLIFGSTTNQQDTQVSRALWIDFKLCSYFWFDNACISVNSCSWVVNWFQIMFLFLVRQLVMLCSLDSHSCELISNYVLIFGSTTWVFMEPLERALWIDFKLCSYFWFDNRDYYRWFFFVVVNWFQIMFLFLVRQPILSKADVTHRCELISNYVLIFGSTTFTCVFLLLE